MAEKNVSGPGGTVAFRLRLGIEGLPPNLCFHTVLNTAICGKVFRRMKREQQQQQQNKQTTTTTPKTPN